MHFWNNINNQMFLFPSEQPFLSRQIPLKSSFSHIVQLSRSAALMIKKYDPAVRITFEKAQTENVIAFHTDLNLPG